jgi:oxygen-independent coproporphyrinogen-3 oxidase
MNYSLYVHIPFCQQRCHYCDFNTYTGIAGLIPAYMESVGKEIRVVNTHLQQATLHSIYFGGGTPSLVPASHYQTLLEGIKACFVLTDDCEISLEANPGTVNLAYLSQLRRMGFNRLSLGVQSTDSFDLTRLDRIHTIEDVLASVRIARQAGFDNLNLDMIFNLPWQDLSSWENSLARAIDLSPEHFSLYALIIEPGTPLSRWYERGWIAKQNEDLEADMFELSMKMLKSAGFVHYEISNWAKKDPHRDYRCRHNLQYWLHLPYIGVGAGAHGYVGGIRTENVLRIPEYIQRMNAGWAKKWRFPGTPATSAQAAMDPLTQMKDFMWLGLRLIDQGVSDERFFNAFGCSIQDVFGEEVEELLRLGLVSWGKRKSASVRLTQRGVMLANQVFMRFV